MPLSETIPPRPRSSAKILREATTIAGSSVALCELVWALRQVYRFDRATTVEAIQALIGAANVVVDGASVAAGLEMIEAGGDFADGVIAHEGAWLGGDVFMSFDKRAVARATRLGRKADLVL